MRTVALSVALSVAVALASAVGSAEPARPAPAKSDAATAPRPVGTVSELMVHVLRPTSDAVFYITTRTPTTNAEWGVLQAQALTLAESGNVLMLPGHARGRAQWLADARLVRDAGQKAFAAAKAKDVPALEALNDELYQSCVACHTHFRAGYGQRP